MKRWTVEDCLSISIFELRIPRGVSQVVVSIQGSSLNQTLDFTATQCYFGGRRLWFRCPACSKRAAILYRPRRDDIFLCRLCHDLTYTSCQYRRSFFAGFWKLLRLNYRRRKIMEKIGQKGMSKHKIQQAVRIIREARRTDLSGLKNRGIKVL